MDHHHSRIAAAAVLTACLAAAGQAAPSVTFEQPARNPASLIEAVRGGTQPGAVPAVPPGREVPAKPAFAANDWIYWAQVKALAHQVDEKATHVHRTAESRAHHGDYWERRALADLHTLEQRAEHFHRQVESYRTDPWHTRRDYQNLLWAFNTADRSSRSAHFDSHVRRDLNAVRYALSRLDWYYRQGGGGHDDDDHDRDPHDRWPWPRDPHDGDDHHRDPHWPWPWRPHW